jgi:histidine triad (HIT) family protein
MTPEKSIFSRIIDKEIPSEIVYEDEKCIVINDINPKARVHLLMLLLPQLAQSQGLDGFKTQINTGESGGQEVFHIHIHLMGE